MWKYITNRIEHLRIRWDLRAISKDLARKHSEITQTKEELYNILRTLSADASKRTRRKLLDLITRAEKIKHRHEKTTARYLHLICKIQRK